MTTEQEIEMLQAALRTKLLQAQQQSFARNWIGEYLCWDRVITFGKERPTPWIKKLKVYAPTEEAAEAFLAKKAAREGLALGGCLRVRHFDPVEDARMWAHYLPEE